MVSFVGFLFCFFFSYSELPRLFFFFSGDGFVCESLVSEGTRSFRFRSPLLLLLLAVFLCCKFWKERK